MVEQYQFPYKEMRSVKYQLSNKLMLSSKQNNVYSYILYI